MAVNLEELVARLRLDSSGLDAGLRKVQGSLQSVGSKMQSAGSTMTRNVSAPIAGLAAVGTKLAADFDSTMRQVALATDEPIGKLKELSMSMSKGTAFSARETSEAMLELAKAGMSAAAIEGGALKATMDAATMGNMALADASTYVVNSMSAFGLKAKDANSIVVALSGGADASTASIESLGQGLSQTAAQAKNTGLSLQETVGVLSAFDQAGIKGSDAGTSLKTMLMRLVPTTKAAKDEMKRLGLNFVNSDGSMKSITNVAEQLRTKLSKLSEAERNTALATMFGSDASRAATVLMNEGSKGLRGFIKATRDKQAAEEKAKSATEGTAGSMKRAKAAMENAGIAVGESLAPHVEKIAGSIEKLATAFSSLPGPMQGMIVKALLAVAVIGPMLSIFGRAAMGAKMLVGGFGAAGKGIAAVGKAGPKAVQGLRNFSSGFKSSQAAASAFSGKMGTLGGVVRNAFSKLGAIVRGAVGGIVKAISGIGRAALAIGRGFMVAVRMVSGALMRIVGVVARAMMLIGRAMLANPWMLLIVALVAVVVLIIKHWDKVKAFLAATWAAIKGAMVAAWNGIKAAFAAVLGAIKAVVVGYFRAYVAVIRAVLNAIRAVVVAVWNGIKATISAVLNAIKAVVTAVWNGIKAVITTQINAAKAVISSVLNAIKAVFTAAWNAIKSAVSAAWSAIKSAVSNGISGVLSLVSSLPGKIVSALGNLGSLLFSKGAELIDGLIGGITSKIGAVGDAIGGIAGKIGGFLPGSPVKEGPLKSWNRGGAGKRLVGMLTDGLDSKREAARDAGRRVARAVNDGTTRERERGVLATIRALLRRQRRIAEKLERKGLSKERRRELQQQKRRIAERVKKAGKGIAVSEARLRRVSERIKRKLAAKHKDKDDRLKPRERKQLRRERRQIGAQIRRMSEGPSLPRDSSRAKRTGAHVREPAIDQRPITWAPTIVNPKPERASESMYRTAQKLAYLGLDREATA